MSGYPTIRTESDYFKGFRVRLFGIKYYLTNSVSDFFWICGKIWEKEGDIWCEIFDFLGIRIWLFENLNYPNQSESDFLISDDICIRLFAIRSLFLKLSQIFLWEIYCIFSRFPWKMKKKEIIHSCRGFWKIL